MACKYWYDNAWRTEEEFKEILSSGVLQELISSGKVSVPGLEMPGTKLKKQPIQLRILHKIQSRINNEREPNTGGKGIPKKNPLDVIAEAVSQGAESFDFKMVIRVGNELHTGKGKPNEKLKEQLLSNQQVNIMENLKEGIPYMLIPSAYGVYPIRLFTHKIKDTEFAKEIETQLKVLEKATDAGKIHAARLKIERRLYRTTVEPNGSGGFIVKRINPVTRLEETRNYPNAQAAMEALGNQLTRIDYTDINKGSYNKQVAEAGAVSTDLFSEDGNFFNSSSFVLEAYAMSEEQKAHLNKALTVKLDTPSSVATSQVQQSIPSNPVKGKPNESPIMNEPIDQATAIVETGKKRKQVIRDFDVPNSNKKVRVFGEVIDGVLTITGAETFVLKINKNNTDERKFITPLTGGREFEDAKKKFFADKYVQQLVDQLRMEKETDELMKQINSEQAELDRIASEAMAADESIIKQAAKSVSQAVQEEVDLAREAVAGETSTGVEDVTDFSDLQKMAESQKNNEKIDEDETLDDGLDNLGDVDFDDLADPDAKFRLAPQSSEKTDALNWDRDQEAEWIKQKLGGWHEGGKGFSPLSRKGRNMRFYNTLEDLEGLLPKEVYEMLIESRKHGRELHGVFTKAAVFMSRNAAVGTGYHEAFHVVFTLALPLNRRIEILNEAYEKYKSEFPLKKKTLKDGSIEYRMPTYLELEEFLADKFMDYTIAENTRTEIKFPEKITRTFKGLHGLIAVFFNPDRPINIDELFEDINLGVYKYSIQFKDTILPNSVRLRSTVNPDRKYDNPIEERHAFEFFEYVMDTYIEQYKKKEGKEHLTDREVIAEIGVHKLYSLMLTNVRTRINVETKKGREELAKRITKFYNIITNNGRAVEVRKVGDTTYLTFKTTTDLLERFNGNLQRRGLYISYKGIKNTGTLFEESEGETFQEFNNEDEVWEEAWMKSHIEVNPLESISQRLKSFFATIPKYKSNRRNAAKSINSFGVVEKENGAEIFKKVIAEISNSYTMNDMMAKLYALEKKYSWGRHILERVDNDPILKTELWASIASKNYATFTAVYEQNGEYLTFNSNRKTLDKIMQEELINAFLNRTNPIFTKQKDGEVDFEDINMEEAKRFHESMQVAIEFARQAGSSSRETLEEFLEDMSTELRRFKINLTKEDLIDIWQPDAIGKDKTWSNIINLFNTLSQISGQLVEGNNPFTNMIVSDVESREDRKKGRTVVETLARQILPALDRELVSSFRNIDGKTVYNLILSGYLNKQMDRLTDEEKLLDYVDSIKDDRILSRLPLLQDLLDEELGMREEFKAVLLDGMTRKGKHRAVSYSDMSDAEMEATSLAMFFSNGSYSGKDKTGFFKLPIPSDSPTIAYVKAKVHSKEEVIKRLVTLAEAEFLRIQHVKTNIEEKTRLSRVKGYAKNGTKFQILEFLNGKIDTNKNFNADEVQKIIEDFFNEEVKNGEFQGEFFKREIAYGLKKQYLTAVTEDGKIQFSEKLIDSRIKDQTAFYKLYLMNTFYMNTQLTTLFGGDPAFYKNTVDYQKRYKQVISPKTYVDPTGQAPTYKGIILKDSIKASRKEFVDDLIERIEASDITEQEKAQLKAIWSAKWNTENKEEFQGNNESDGATWISMRRRKQQLQGLGRWTDAHEAAYKRIEAEQETLEDIMLFNSPFKPEKPFVYTQILVDGTMVPVQVKNAETVLIPSYAKKSPELTALYNDFQAEKFDVAMFESAVKEGAILNSDGEFSTYVKQADGSYQLVENHEIIELPSDDWGLQQETPPHFVDERGNFGTQLRNLIIADIKMDKEYDINGKKLKGRDVARLYQELVVEDIRTSFEDVREMFEDENGDINYERLISELRKEVIDRELGQDYLDALAPITDALGRTTGTALPLYHPMISYKMESVMNSFFKNRVTKQKIAGGAFINTTSFGVSDQLKMYIDEETGGIVYQALLPAWSKQFFPKNADGEVDIEALKKDPNAKELLRIVGYRIPTEDKYSMFNIEVVGFTPMAMGGTVILPVEATTMAGLDFDIDKLYFMARAFKLNRQGKPEAIKYIENIETPEQREALAKNIFSNFKDFKRFVRANVSSRKDQERMLEGHREFLDKFLSAKDEEIQNIKIEIDRLKLERKELREAGYSAESDNVRAIQEMLDEQYQALQEFIPFEEGSFEAQKAQEVLDFIVKRLETGFNPVTFNTRQARDNRKLDLIQGILQSHHTVAAIANPGNFDSLKESAAKIRLFQAGNAKAARTLTGEELIKEAEKLDAAGFNINYPSTQAELYRRNMMGKQLVGIFANHNVHHAKAQFTSLRLTNPIEFDGIPFEMLNQVNNYEGKRISRVLATDVAAVVDNAKEPLSSFLNSNTFTANSVALMQRLGIPEDTIWAFLNQPVILELTQKYFNDRGSLSDEKQFAAIRSKWETILREKLTEEERDVPLEITTELLQNNLVPSKTKEYYKLQLAVLTKFNEIQRVAKELSEVVNASRADVNGVGPTSAENYVTIQRQLSVLQNPEPLILGAEEVFFTEDGDQIMIPAFTKYGIWGPVTILDKISKSIGKFDARGNLQLSMLGLMKKEIARQKGTKRLTDKEARSINTHFMNFLASGFPFFSSKEATSITRDMPDRLSKMKETMPKDAPYRILIDNLYTVKSTDQDTKQMIQRIEFYSTGKKTYNEIRPIKAAWERMLLDSDPEIKQFALDLVKYTYHASGYGFGPFSFAHLIPTTFWTNEYMIANGIVDERGRPFNDFLERGMNEFAGSATGMVWQRRFVDQYMRNVGWQSATMPAVTINKYLKKEDEGATLETRDFALTKKARETAGGIVVASNGMMVVNKVKNTDLFPDGLGAEPVRFVKVPFKKKRGYQIFEFVKGSDTTGQKDNGVYGNKADTVTYKPVATLGHRGFMMHYDLLKDITESEIPWMSKAITSKSLLSLNPDSDADAALQAMIAEAESGGIDIDNQPLTFSPTNPIESVSLTSLTGQKPAETKPTSMRKTYSGKIESLQENQIFVFGSNPEGRHGAGAAKYAKDNFGAIYGQGEGMQGQSYALPTKDLRVKENNSLRSISAADITDSIRKLYEVARQNPTKEFLVADYSGNNLSGYTGQEMATMFDVAGPIPSNIIFHEDFDKLVSALQIKSEPKGIAFLKKAATEENKGLFEALSQDLWAEYATLDGPLSQEDFVVLSEREQKEAIWQLKNCKKG